MENIRFAAFIITFERTEILLQTIKKVFSQSLPPEKILIIDNGSTNKTKDALVNFDDRVEYFCMQYNSGPAGGAKKGLEILSKEGYKWIYWGDDDDPPPTEDSFEILIKLGESYGGNCGQVGVVGHRFNKLTGRFIRTSNKDLINSDYLVVDCIGGGMCKIVNSRAVLKGASPEEKLFFGFEDLDFDLSTKKAGFDILVDSKLFLRCRKRANRLNYKKKYNIKKDVTKIWREYYSIRNGLYILKKNNLLLALAFSLVTNVIKSIVGYKYGFRYGNYNSRIIYKAIYDFLKGNFTQPILK